jgi:hypothetical protein
MRSDMAAVKARARGRSASLVIVIIMTFLVFEVDVVDDFLCLGWIDDLNRETFPTHRSQPRHCHEGNNVTATDLFELRRIKLEL